MTDLDFADDLALLCEEIEQAQEVLLRLETEAENVGLFCNAKKTEVQAFNQERPVIIKAKDGETLKVVDNFKYLEAWTKSTESDISVRKALAWTACHRLRRVWSSKLRRQIKERLFLATVESVLLTPLNKNSTTKNETRRALLETPRGNCKQASAMGAPGRNKEQGSAENYFCR